MKKKLFAALLFSAFFVQTVFAVLPPYYQSVREMQLILESERLHDLLGSGELIEAICAVSDGYIVKTRSRTVRVNVIYKHSDSMPGPGEIELEFHNSL